LALGFLLGAGATILILRGDDTATLTTTTQNAAASDAPTRIGDVVDGFPDGLVAVSRSDGLSLQLIIWPAGGEQMVRTIPVGVARQVGPVTFDVSALRIASLLPVPDESHGVLYAGVPEKAAIVATEVTGYAWHDTAPTRLAYTTMADGELLLWSLPAPVADPQLVTRTVGIVGALRTWGDWGFAIQDEEHDSVVLLTDTGEIKATHPGRILDSDGAEWLAVADDGVTLISSGGGVVAGPEALNHEVVAARFSPQGDEIALLAGDRATVVSLDTGATLVESGERPGIPEVAWTSDGRFVAYPGERGIVVLDTTDGSSTVVLTDRIFTGLGFLPGDIS
jgi:hypothetical protein